MAFGLDDGGVEVVVAHIVGVGAAQPVGWVGVGRAGVAGIRVLRLARRNARDQGGGWNDRGSEDRRKGAL